MLPVLRSALARLGSRRKRAQRFHRAHIRSPRFGLVTWLYIGLSIVLGYVAPQINQWFFPWLISPLDKSSISTILSAIAAGMITLTGIVFSLVFVIVQFGSSTYSPRITRIFAHVRALRHSLGIFTGTFIYSLMALRTIGISPGGTVSAFTVWLAFAWLLASVTILTGLVRVFTTLTIGNVLFTLTLAGRYSIARVYDPLTEGGGGQQQNAAGDEGEKNSEGGVQMVTYHGEPGYVIRYNMDSMVALARKTGTVIQLLFSVGDALRDGEVIAIVRGDHPSIREKRLFASIILGRERAFRDDPRYALRLLVDMAIRALSPAINDPTTAVQALDHIEMLLHRLGNSNLDVGEVRDADGNVRLVYSAPNWEDFLRLGVSEIMQYGATSLQVQRRLAAMLDFLSRAVPPARAAIVERLAEERRAIVASGFADERFRALASVPDPGGLGGASVCREPDRRGG